MGHDLGFDRVDSLISSDPEPPLLDACETVLTRTTSDSSSSITVANNSFHDLELHSPFPGQSTRWTNQQHSLYLNHLEDSFVNELHRSISLHGWRLQNSIDKDSKSRTLQKSINMPRQQSLAIQDGFLKKISHERIEHMLESTAESHVVAESRLGLASLEKGNSLTEPNAYDDALFRDDGIHGKGISKFSKRSPGILEKQSNCRLFHLELVGSTTGSFYCISLSISFILLSK
ncbi:hypothetical protein TanjilG_27939 [Lupinus angustifolius]|uniref:Uncharacterized protein n=1 Tax=Lupinus angustifolius TaxID=3871 RepID=A0A4P1RGQ7_LUPAN|nr:hypothetical protein TanjilG_27939 [Lupinus angustifolius]